MKTLTCCSGASSSNPRRGFATTRDFFLGVSLGSADLGSAAVEGGGLPGPAGARARLMARKHDGACTNEDDKC